MSSRNDLKVGILILAAGLVILLGQWGLFAFIGRLLWPLLLFIPGLILQALCLNRRAPALLLVPGGVLTVYGLLFGICNIWGYGLLSFLWPVFLLGIAVGLLEYYFFDRFPKREVLLAGVVLGAVSLVLIFFTLMASGALYILAIVLILAGLWLILGRKKIGRFK